MGYIFISYSHKDKAYVHRLTDALRTQGFDVWIDDRIDYGTRWPRVIQEQLDGCDAFIVIISENSFESYWVQSEVTRAQRKGKPFFPLLLSGDLWLSVEVTQYVDVTDQLLPPERFFRRLEGVTSGQNISAGSASSIPSSGRRVLGNENWRNWVGVGAGLAVILAFFLLLPFLASRFEGWLNPTPTHSPPFGDLLTATPTLTATSFANFTAVVGHDSYCYNGPSESYPSSTVLRAGVEVDLLAMNSDGGDWILVDFGSTRCWLSASVIKDNTDIDGILVLTTAQTKTDAVCRTGPDVSYKAQTYIPECVNEMRQLF